MELYYDALVPYMPDSTRNSSGEMEHSDVIEAGRKAMMELSEFQLTGNAMSLYQAVIMACKYAEVDLIDTILNGSEDITIEPTMTVKNLIDESAKMLFKSINPENSFNVDKFTAYVLTAAHLIFLTIQQNAAKEAQEADSKEENNN